jgi:hypothetical protein
MGAVQFSIFAFSSLPRCRAHRTHRPLAEANSPGPPRVKLGRCVVWALGLLYPEEQVWIGRHANCKGQGAVLPEGKEVFVRACKRHTGLGRALENNTAKHLAERAFCSVILFTRSL